MKKSVIFSIIILVVTACSINNNERKAKKLIKDYLKMNMNDFASYEPMAFSPIDTSFSKAETAPAYQSLMNQYKANREDKKYWENILEEVNNRNKVYGRIIDKRGPFIEESVLPENEASCVKLLKEIESVKTHFKPKMIGYQISHQFRGANAFGGKIISYKIFYFDKAITRIINFDDINELPIN